jgi:hypothetical protein
MTGASFISYEAYNMLLGYLEKRIAPYSPAEGGVSATPVRQARPKTPQHNRRRYPNIQGSVVPSQYCTTHPCWLSDWEGDSRFPHLLQPRIPTIAMGAEKASFFLVLVNAGVYVGRQAKGDLVPTPNADRPPSTQGKTRAEQQIR